MSQTEGCFQGPWEFVILVPKRLLVNQSTKVNVFLPWIDMHLLFDLPTKANTLLVLSRVSLAFL